MLNFISYFYFWKPVMLRQNFLLGQKNQASVEHILSYTKVLFFYYIAQSPFKCNCIENSKK